MDSANWRSNILSFLSINPSFLFWTSKLYPRLCKVLSHQTNDVTVHLTESSHDTFVSPLCGLWSDICKIMFHQAKEMSVCQLTLIITHLFCHVLAWDHQYHFGQVQWRFHLMCIDLGICDYSCESGFELLFNLFPYFMSFVIMALNLLQLLYKFVQTFSKGS